MGKRQQEHQQGRGLTRPRLCCCKILKRQRRWRCATQQVGNSLVERGRGGAGRDHAGVVLKVVGAGGGAGVGCQC